MTVSSEIVENDKIRDIINSDYKDSEFIELMREITADAIQKNSFYREIVDDKGFKVEDLNTIDDLSEIPYIPGAYFKQSANKFKKLLKIPEDSSEFKAWNVSSCTTGDPSLVGRSQNDNELLASMTIKCIYDFIPIPEDQWYNTISFNFAPKISFLNRIALRYTDIRPVMLYSSNLHKISTRMSDPYFLIKFRVLKAIKEIILRRELVGAF